MILAFSWRFPGPWIWLVKSKYGVRWRVQRQDTLISALRLSTSFDTARQPDSPSNRQRNKQIGREEEPTRSRQILITNTWLPYRIVKRPFQLTLVRRVTEIPQHSLPGTLQAAAGWAWRALGVGGHWSFSRQRAAFVRSPVAGFLQAHEWRARFLATRHSGHQLIFLQGAAAQTWCGEGTAYLESDCLPMISNKGRISQTGIRTVERYPVLLIL
ncbi:hypothetical protein BD289DRAFT_295121 [Coniella lustricola]|uniref:Uncharacterized protein n=1 Tax=Coniella lustricola TaxID=2025994 RepID=A0A2T3A4W2_9PEZI|nr:hypothetical protein BD289DRAFT_295121 [Coniella lustricola]